MEEFFRDEINSGQKIKTVLGLNPKLDLEKIHASLISGIQALTERLSKIPQQCEI